MKEKIILLLVLVVIFPVTVFASDVDEVVATVLDARPSDWQIHIDSKKRPPWARSNEKCVEIEMYGPTLGGRAYLDSSGKRISERWFLHESVMLWVTAKGYDSGWNLFTRLLNWFSPWAIEFPDQIGEHNGVKVFAAERYYAESEEINADSPEGTASSYFLPPPSGRAWQTWRDDIDTAIKKMAPTTP